MTTPTQPRNSIFIVIRLGNEELPRRIIPLNLLAQLPAILQADIFQAQAPQLMAAEMEERKEKDEGS